MVDSKRKRIFADVSEDLANRFLATAKLHGTTGQALIEQWAFEFTGGKLDIVTKTSESLLQSLLHSSHPTASALLRIAITAAGELDAIHGDKSIASSEEADISRAIADAARLAAKANRTEEIGDKASRKVDIRVGGRRTGGGRNSAS